MGDSLNENELLDAEKKWFAATEYIKQYPLVDAEYLLNDYLTQNANILAEGAQGTMLDVDFGSYPFVTSSSTVCAGACTGMGVAPRKIGRVYGIFKAYCTRVGAGPFPTELHDAVGDQLRNQGFEFGATTGRPRRCGWLDLVALRYAIMLNGVTDLIMTKADVLSNFEQIRVATAYKQNGERIEHLPYTAYPQPEPVYQDFKGWQQDIAHCKKYDELPSELQTYISFIEKETGVPISIISLGADREATLCR